MFVDRLSASSERTESAVSEDDGTGRFRGKLRGLPFAERIVDGRRIGEEDLAGSRDMLNEGVDATRFGESRATVEDNLSLSRSCIWSFFKFSMASDTR